MVRYYKNVSTLKKYFQTCKRLLAHYFRVAYCNRKHFRPTLSGQSMPGDGMRLTSSQKQAAHDVVDAAHDNNGPALTIVSSFRV